MMEKYFGNRHMLGFTWWSCVDAPTPHARASPPTHEQVVRHDVLERGAFQRVEVDQLQYQTLP